jgi:hypothetical protein
MYRKIMNRGSEAGMPRWVKGLLVVAVVALIGLGALLLIGGGEQHGPGRHTDVQRAQWS